MEPVNGAGQLATDLQKPVIPRNVGEFMRKHDAPPVFLPVGSGGRKYYEWLEKSPSERHGRGIVA